ncbi:Protein glass, partial [Stegodyphus mimosarum]
MSTDTKERPLSCGICCQPFLEQYNLDAHVCTHPIKKEKCNICDKLFSCQARLKSHMDMHRRSKPHQCDICNKAFSTKGILINETAKLKEGVELSYYIAHMEKLWHFDLLNTAHVVKSNSLIFESIPT